MNEERYQCIKLRYRYRESTIKEVQDNQDSIPYIFNKSITIDVTIF